MHSECSVVKLCFWLVKRAKLYTTCIACLLYTEVMSDIMIVKLSTIYCRRLVKRAMHGTRMLSWSEIRELYGREVVNLRNEGRWVFLNTLFSVSEAVMYMQVRGANTEES